MLSKNQVKYIQSLGQKKFRETEKAFLVEGPKSVREFLTNPRTRVLQVYALESWARTEGATFPSLPLTIIEPADLDRISQLNTPHQVLLVASFYSYPETPVFPGKWTLALDTIQDPGNLGTLLRIADWFGIRQVICSDECADWYNPKVVQASMGSLGRLDLFRGDLSQWLQQTQGVRVYAATLDGRPVKQIGPQAEGVLLIGNESKGLQESLIQRADVKVTIPRIGEAESLNAAVATGILLSHLI